MNNIRFKKDSLCIEKLPALNLAKKYNTPFYCYSLSQLKDNFIKFRKIFKQISPLICFSVKSNPNLTLLKELKKIGSGADVVSAGEMLKAIKAGISPKKIVFSGVGKTDEELKIAINKKILLINIESENEAFLINKIAKRLGKKTSVGIRLYPNVIGKTHKKISTGSKNEKFGLLYDDCAKLCEKIKKMKNLNLNGLSVHIGSQITNVQPFKNVLHVLNRLIKKTKIHFKFIDLGGGMGISYSNKDKEIDLKKYSEAVKKFLKNKRSKIIFEPGRLIVGNTAILICKVLYIKKSHNKKFIILDAGMNDLMRPALYNAEHEIIPLKKSKKKIIGKIEFVGPVCESSDKFLNKKIFPKIKERDFVCFTHVGAYGMSLSSNYNLRPTISEIMVTGSKHKLIKKRQNLKDLIKN